MFRILNKYSTRIALWYWVFHYCGLKQILLDASFAYMPSLKTDKTFYTTFMALAGGEIGLSLAICIAYNYMRKDEALLVLTALAIGNTLNSILKTFWHEPRPFSISEAIVPAKCSNFEYGLPSGHTMGYLAVMRTFTRLIEQQ